MVKKYIGMVVYSHYSRDARVRRYAESLARQGFHVDVICLAEDYLPAESSINLIKYPLSRKRFGRIWYLFEYLLFFFFSTFVLSINFFIKRYRFIHINNMPEILVFAAVIPKIFGAKVILDMHDPMPELYMSKYHASENGLMVKWLKWLENISLNFADYIITANESFKELFLIRNDIPKNKISVILNCPDPKIFKPISNQQSAINNRSFTLLYMGTVEKRFGLDIAIDAVPTLMKRIPHFRFVIIPKLEEEGEYFKNSKFKIQNSKLNNYITFLTPLPLEKIAEMLQKADIGIVLAKNGVFTENIFPVKLLEFIQMDIPVIASKTKILSRYFTDRQIYFLKKNTPKEFAQAVLKLYKDKKLRQSFSQNARQYLKSYNWAKEEKKYLKLITKEIQ